MNGHHQLSAPASRHLMGFLNDLKVLYHVAWKPIRSADHASRLESFYAGQAELYEDYRRRLLPGRAELYRAIPTPERGIWVDLGGGTGANFESIGPELAKIARVYLVDLCPSLLAIARRRIAEQGWANVDAVLADATTFRPPEGLADVVTFSYSLTMMPDWAAAFENARAMLRPGGTIGVVDFFVSRKYPEAGRGRHGWFTRSFWPLWFSIDNVFLSPDHVPFLHRHFEAVEYVEGRMKLPFLRLLRVPYYRFVGRARSSSQ